MVAPEMPYDTWYGKFVSEAEAERAAEIARRAGFRAARAETVGTTGSVYTVHTSRGYFRYWSFLAEHLVHCLTQE